MRAVDRLGTQALDPDTGRLGNVATTVGGGQVAARDFGADEACDAGRDRRRVHGPGPIDIRGRGEKRPVLLLEVPAQAGHRFQLPVERLAEPAVRQRSQGATCSEEEQARQLQHQVALERVELGDDQAEDDRSGSQRDGKPPAPEDDACPQGQQAACGRAGQGGGVAAARVERGARQHEHRRGGRKADPESDLRSV